jgi:rhodanese-related sulfurtransferase
MLIPTDQALMIDIRSSAEVMLFGIEEQADAHIPYYGGPVDEWNLFQQSFLTQSNDHFIKSVFSLIVEFGLYRDSSIILVSKSRYKGLRAASLLQVAGFKNVQTEIRVAISDRLVTKANGKRIGAGKRVDLMSEKTIHSAGLSVVH